jgi:hypothetical protein
MSATIRNLQTATYVPVLPYLLAMSLPALWLPLVQVCRTSKLVIESLSKWASLVVIAVFVEKGVTTYAKE